MRATYWVLANGVDIGSTLSPILTSITIRDSEGGKSDTLEIELDDAEGQIALPPTNTPIEAGIGWEEEGGGATAPPVQFSGKVDKVSSAISRGGGLMLTISAKSADEKGKPKERQEKHHDSGKLSEVAQKWGQDAGLNVTVASGIDCTRTYWAMQGEDFLDWGTRIAREVGATFKVRNGQAVFAERSSGQSIDGQSLPTITVERGVNLISGNLSPMADVDEWSKFQVRWYDKAKAKYVTEETEEREKPGTVKHTHRFGASDADDAKRKAKSNDKEADRSRGGGSVTIVGNPSAQAECPCEVIGWRPGIDGTYRVSSAEHKLTRSAGYQTTLELQQPSGKAGDDDREGKS